MICLIVVWLILIISVKTHLRSDRRLKAEATGACHIALVRRIKVRNTNFLRTKCPNYLTKELWTPNSPDLNPLVIPWLGQRWRLSQQNHDNNNDNSSLATSCECNSSGTSLHATDTQVQTQQHDEV